MFFILYSVRMVNSSIRLPNVKADLHPWMQMCMVRYPYASLDFIC